eukprot:2739809-Prymnesium_polylepis.2
MPMPSWDNWVAPAADRYAPLEQAAPAPWHAPRWRRPWRRVIGLAIGSRKGSVRSHNTSSVSEMTPDSTSTGAAVG